MAFKDLKWQRIVPELGERSPEIVILRVDPNTQATQLMIRVPKNTHVPKHWHTANETHTIMSGTFIIECEEKRVELGPDSFNYVPSKMAHEAWTGPEEGTLLSSPSMEHGTSTGSEVLPSRRTSRPRRPARAPYRRGGNQFRPASRTATE